MSKTIIKMNGSRFSLARESDGVGDSGSALHPIGMENPINGELHLGYGVLCGSSYARSYSNQDYWMTTPILEFLNVNDDTTEVRFRTQNSVYIVKVI